MQNSCNLYVNVSERKKCHRNPKMNSSYSPFLSYCSEQSRINLEINTCQNQLRSVTTRHKLNQINDYQEMSEKVAH